MSNTRRAAVLFAATAIAAVAGASSASAAIDPGTLPIGNVADVTSITSTVTGTAGSLPIVGGAVGSATDATKMTEDLPLVGDATDGLLGGDLPGGDLTDGVTNGLLGDDLLGDDLLGDDVVKPVTDTVEDLVDTVGDDVLNPVLETVTTVVDDVTDTVDGVVGDVTDTVDGVLADNAGKGAAKPAKAKAKAARKIVDDSDHGAMPQGGVRAGAGLPHTGASALPLYLLAGGAAMAAGGVGLRRFIIRAGR